MDEKEFWDKYDATRTIYLCVSNGEKLGNSVPPTKIGQISGIRSYGGVWVGKCVCGCDRGVR